MSETPKFTPGPWEVGKSETHGIFWIQAPGEGVCDLYIKVDDTTFSPFRNAEANAHLIAAAPELYGEGRASARTMEDVADALGERGLLDLADELRARARLTREALLRAEGLK